MALNYGLDGTGFIAPTYEEILDSVEDDFRTRFGDDIVLTSNSNFGIIARLFAWDLAKMLQSLQQNYYAAFLSTATDTSLDRLGNNIGVYRKVENPSSTVLKITTDGEYLMEAGEGFETADGITFHLLNDVVSVKDADGNWVANAPVESDEKGSMNNVPANSITVVSNPDENILSVTNPEPARGGQDYEDDEAFRARLILENSARPGPTIAGINSALLALPGVKQVNIVSNPGDQTDKEGNPAYSVHVYVLGGAKDDIIQTLAERCALGIRLDGNEKGIAKNATDNKNVYAFDYATEVPIFVKVNVKTGNGWDLKGSADEVKQAVADSINGIGMGHNVYLTKLYPTVYSIEGVDEAEITIAKSAADLSSASANSDIVIHDYEAPTCDTDNVEVDTNGN